MERAECAGGSPQAHQTREVGGRNASPCEPFIAMEIADSTSAEAEPAKEVEGSGSGLNRRHGGQGMLAVRRKADNRRRLEVILRFSARYNLSSKSAAKSVATAVVMARCRKKSK
jgi:hypothetical protein